MDEIKEALYELAYDLDFYLESEEECKRALFIMAHVNEMNSQEKVSIYSFEEFYILKDHINNNF